MTPRVVSPNSSSAGCNTDWSDSGSNPSSVISSKISMPSSDQPWVLADALQLPRGFGQGDIETLLAGGDAGEQELKGERRLPGPWRALDQEQPLRLQAAVKNLIEASNTGREPAGGVNHMSSVVIALTGLSLVPSSVGHRGPMQLDFAAAIYA